MRNRLVMAGLVLGMIISVGICTKAGAYSPMYGVAPLELNNQILDTTNSMHNNMIPTTSKQLTPIPSSQKNTLPQAQTTSAFKTNNKHIYEKNSTK